MKLDNNEHYRERLIVPIVLETYQHQMESTCLPLVNSFTTVVRHVVFNLALLHEHSQNSLIDRVI